MKNKKIHFNKSRGFALVWSLLISMIILVMASSMVLLVVKDLRITSNIDESNRAYLAAEAGMERALYEVKRKGFGWCGATPIPGNGTNVIIDTDLIYNYNVEATTSPTGCHSITVESTGTEKEETNRKIKLNIVYGPTNNIEKYDSLPDGFDSSGAIYPFPPTLVGVGANSRPLLVQQFDFWDLQELAVGRSIVVGMNSNGDNNFGVRIRRAPGVNAAEISLVGRIGGVLVSSSASQLFTFSPGLKYRVVTEYSRVSRGTYGNAVVRSVVLKRDAATGEEKYICPGSDKSYTVYGGVSGSGVNPVDPVNVKVGDSALSIPAPSLSSSLGNGYLVYSAGGSNPGAIKIDNMVFWGRE